MKLDEVRTKWAHRQYEYGRMQALVNGKVISEEVLHDLDQLEQSEQSEILTLREAALRSGYSEDHLGLLLRKGKILNSGRKGAPRIRVADLPRKPQANIAQTSPRSYDVDADVRSLRNRRHQ